MRMLPVATLTASIWLAACQSRDSARPVPSEKRTNDAQTLPTVALRNWKLHVDEFAAIDDAGQPGQARQLLRSFDSSIGGNFAWREHGIDYGRWALPPALAQQLTTLVASPEFAALCDALDQRGPRMQVTLAWPGGQRVVTVAPIAAFSEFATAAVAAQRATLLANTSAWTIEVTGPLMAAIETMEVTSAGAITVKLASGAVVTRGQLEVGALGKLTHLLSLPRLREAPPRVPAATAVPTSFRLQLAALPAAPVQVVSGLQPALPELSELWDVVVAARVALAGAMPSSP